MQMLFKVMIVAVFGILFLLGPALLFFIKFDNKTPIGSLLKSRVLRYPAFVTLVNLNEPGDWRYRYTDDSRLIIVTIYYSKSSQVHPQAENWIREMILQTTGKQAQIQIQGIEVPIQLTQAVLNNLRNQYVPATPSQPYLNIFYLPEFADKPTYAGITLHRDTLFVFTKTLSALTPRQDEQARLEQSTLMHEWGHLVGMDHSDFPSCIMSAVEEVYDQSTFKNSIVTRYCWDELYQLQSIKR